MIAFDPIRHRAESEQNPVKLNQGAARIVATFVEQAERLGIQSQTPSDGAQVIDCGVKAPGGLEAGRLLAEACLGGHGQVSLAAGGMSGQRVVVRTDHPVAACMGAQYAGWSIAPAETKYFAMGSGPMRAVANREPIIAEIDAVETPGEGERVVGVLETSQLPTPEVADYLADRCHIAPSQLVLLAARTASIAGAIQVVARSVETALHKMHEIGFPLAAVRSGFGAAPLPPIAKDDLQGIGWTNDAVLYGGEVTLWVDADDELLQELGPRIPSSASSDHGAPFAEIFRRYHGDFYQIDPLLFSPAVVHLQSLASARRFSFGKLDESLLRTSFQW